ncbi:MAG: hypothetical protein M0Q38_10125 [Bacteroidales bacterium]|nr:hypothetical protein [Bacteroidales bacterium]
MDREGLGVGRFTISYFSECPQYLLNLFHQLADQGNTLLIIEHDPDIISHADWVIELGPEGGDKGGYVMNSDVCRQ